MNELQTVCLENNQGMTVEIINYGARIKSIHFPVNGVATEMTVGYPDPNGYLADAFYLGATCGRVCNRIEEGKFDLKGVSYQLAQNENEHCLHGGGDNFSYRYWQIESSSSSAVTLTLKSPDGDQGFPGELNLQVMYHLTENNALEMRYHATVDVPTPINITNHAYFNLGENSCELLDLQLDASNMLERKDNGLPSGNILPVANSDFDFTEFANIGDKQSNTTDSNLIEMACFDHCFVLDDTEITIPKAVLLSKNNGVKMTLFTDQPAVQLYTGVGLSGEFRAYQGVCLEAQNYSNAVNISHFPNSILQPNEEYKRTIIYHFESIDLDKK
jgi:aldose 1-epimerase